MSFTVTLRDLIVTALWTIGAVLAAVDVIYPPNLGALAVGFMMGATTLSVRGRIDRHASNWETAYDAGREVAKVRQMR